MKARSGASDVDPAHAFFARLCLDDELFGPDDLLTEEEALARVADLRGAARAEALDLLCKPRLLAQQRFRSRVDRVADLWPAAGAAAQSGVGVFHDSVRRGLGIGTLPNWRTLQSTFERLSGDIKQKNRLDVLAEPAEELEPVWLLVDAVSALLNAYPELQSLPWAPDWILRLAQDRPAGKKYRTDRMRPLSVLGAGGIRTVRVDPPDPELEPVEVDWSDSREETRQRLDAKLERLVYPAYLKETGQPLLSVPDAEALRSHRPFRRWLRRSELWSQTQSALKSTLDKSHPPGRRPYARDPFRRIRRDIYLWAQVNIWGQRDLDLAGDHKDRYDAEPTFRSRTGGSRPRLPRTAKGVRDAVRRAQRLLQEPEI